MTMKPKATKYHIRRKPSAAPQANTQGQTSGAAEDVSEDGASVEERIEAIKAEGLTARQLRMARRVAQKYGIEATSDYDAVRILRGRGIDPFKSNNVFEVVAGQKANQEKAPVNLPQTVAQPAANLPAPPGLLNEEQRASEIMRIQKDLAKRRQRRLLGLFTRLSFFVFLPTILTAYYFMFVATPMYATNSEFVIQQAESQSAAPGSGFGALFQGGAQDAITIQSYLQSREAMLRLDKEHGFREHFSNPDIDPIQRLDPNASNETAYDLYQRVVKIGYDPTEGLIKMEIIAAEPQISAAFSRALISYAEEEVDQLTQRLREGQMKGARESYDEAEENMRTAQQRVLSLQEQRGVLSADAEISSLMSQISTFEIDLRKKQLELQELQDNPRPNATRVEVTERNIARLEQLIADLRNQLTESGTDNASLARISSELAMAEVDLQTRQALFARSLEQLEAARIEASRQVRYVKTGVSPIPPDEATYPRIFENTIVAFLIFSGIYLMISLTASILREQVSA